MTRTTRSLKAETEAAVKTAIRRHAEANDGLPHEGTVEKFIRELADERPGIGAYIDAHYPTRIGVRRLAVRLWHEAEVEWYTARGKEVPR